MTADPLRIRAGEGEVLRLFGVAPTPEGLDLVESWETARRADALAAALGADGELDAARAVLVDPRDLGGMSVAGYLSEGWDAPDAELMRLGPALAALDGALLILPPSVFGPAPRALAPSPALDVLGAVDLGPPGAAPTLATPAAAGLAATAEDAPTPRETVGAQLKSTLWTAAILAIGIVAVAIWIGRSS